MRKTEETASYLLIVGAALLGLLLLLTYLTLKTAEAAHEFTAQQCYRCHIDPDGQPEQLTAPITKLCKGCHYKVIRSSSHPVNVVPAAVRVPSDMPLTDGRVTCITCHDVHAEGMLAFGVKSYLLRRPGTDMSYFCRACHVHNDQSPGHVELAGLAHIGYESAKNGFGGNLDPLSSNCVSCHDGATGTNIEMNQAGYYQGYSSEGSHPVGIFYEGKGWPPRGRGLAPVSRLDRRIKLFGGKIGCGTCHDFYSSGPGKLVMSNDESRLCRQCHIDK